MPTLARREFFKKILSVQDKLEASDDDFIAPPFFSGKFDCANCEAPCVEICHRNLLEKLDNAVKFDPNKGGCDFCEDCAKVCPNQVLSLDNPKLINATTKIEVLKCISWNEVVCYSCADSCPYKAIKFFGMFRPSITDKCLNCAQCISSCFVGAISVVKKESV